MEHTILEAIKQASTIVIKRHVNPDGDALGAQWGLYELIKTNFPDKTLFCPGDDIGYLAKIFPNPTGEPDDAVQNTQLTIVCDTANQERISTGITTGTHIIKIDHHPDGENYGTSNIIDEKAASTCEIITALAVKWNWIITAQAAQYLYCGIVTDSGRFLYPAISSNTFQAAQVLIEANAQITNIYEKLYTQEELQLRSRGLILNNFKLLAQGKIAYFAMKPKMFRKFNKKFKHLTSSSATDIRLFVNQVNTLSNIKDTMIWLIAGQETNKAIIRISLRSAKLPINGIAQEFGGGGHLNAAGIKLSDWKTVDKMLQKLEHLVATTANK